MIPDISHYHPVQSWSQVKKSCDLIISKATQGTSYTDPTLRSFVAGCEANGIPYWLYTYLNAGNELAQAKYMFSVCKGIVGSKFVGYILDVEAGNPASGVKSALDYLNGLGGQTMIYTMYAQYSTYKSVIAGRGSRCAWWEARYGNNNGSYNASYPAHSGCDLHQYTSLGKCSGIGSGVDLNRICGSKSLDWFKGVEGMAPTNDVNGKGGEDLMECTFQVDGKADCYWFDGTAIRKLYHGDQLNIIRRIYKDATGRTLPHYKWTSNAPWFWRLQQALDAEEVRFEKQSDGTWVPVNYEG